MKRWVRATLKFAGKGEQKVASVFGLTPASCHAAVAYVRHGAPEIPVWLFSTTQPLPETAALCENVYVYRSSLALLLQAELRLWSRWVAISVATWTGGHGGWSLKLAPFLIPPFRTLLLNSSGDFFPGTPANVLLHWWRRLSDATRFAKDEIRAVWLLLTYHAWRSGPVTRAKDVAHAHWRLITYHIWRSGPVTRAKDVSHAHWRLVSYHLWRSSPIRRTKDVLRSLALLWAATLLRWLSYPDRNLFKKLHGSELLAPSFIPGIDFGVVRFRPNGLRWDGAELEQFARLSSARWILWQESGADDAVDDMLPLFADQRTFAVSRQTSFQSGNAGLFATAPVRTLQPGEASQVLAPLSGQILVDRRKLLALGIPHSSMVGTAWMLLFWKAAAANWHSYSMGQLVPTVLGPQPDFPVQERAFLFRVLSSPALRRLGPGGPDLARGNIAFQPAPLAPRSEADRLRVLVASPFLPYPLSHGGAVRIFNLCRALAGRVDFQLVAFREKRDVVNYDKLHEIFREVYVLDKDERPSNDPRLPAQVRESQSASLKALLAELVRKCKPDLLQIEYTHMAGFRESLPGVPAILVEHDLTFSLHQQLKTAGRESERWLAFERHWLAVYEGVWTVSDDDRHAAIREGSHADRTFTVANGVDIRRFVPREEPSPTPEILYVGSFRHLPNVLGFEKLRQEVMPRVWRVVPNVRLRVVAGPEYQRFWQKADLDPRIEVHGFVEDLRPLYAAASAVVAPLAVSAGTNIKVLEAMACGKAVVTTQVGCAGLGLEDGQDALISSDWADFSRSVCGLLSDVALRARVAANARRTVEERFSWTAIAECAYQSYATLTCRALAMTATVQ